MENKKLTKFQQEIVEILEKEGFTSIHFNTWSKYGRVSYNIDKIKTIADLMTTMYRAGAQEKIWEIKKVLEVV